MAKGSSSRADSRPPKPGDRVVALVGKELFLRQEYTAQLRAGLEAAHGQVDTVRYDGASAPAADVLDECRSFGLLAAHKLVLVDDADLLINAQTRPLFLRYCDAPSDGATLVLRADKWIASGLDDRINAVGTLFRCEAVSDDQALRWAVKRARHAHNAALADDAARLLLDRTGPDLSRLDTELGKLAASVGTAGAITREAVLELVGQTREEELWGVQAELLSAQPARAIAHIRRLLDGAPKDAAVLVTFACVDLTRKLMSASAALRQGANPNTLTRELKLWGPSGGPLLDAARRLHPRDARRLFAQAVDADAAQKSGLGRSDRVLERLAVRITSALAQPARR